MLHGRPDAPSVDVDVTVPDTATTEPVWPEMPETDRPMWSPERVATAFEPIEENAVLRMVVKPCATMPSDAYPTFAYSTSMVLLVSARIPPQSLVVGWPFPVVPPTELSLDDVKVI